MRVFVFVLLALAACKYEHNQAAEHAWTLHDKAGCFDIARSTSRYGDVAECEVEGKTWLCTSSPRRCRLVGPTVQIMLNTHWDRYEESK